MTGSDMLQILSESGKAISDNDTLKFHLTIAQ